MCIVSAARAELVYKADIIAALDKEPLSANHPLVRLPSIIGSRTL